MKKDILQKTGSSAFLAATGKTIEQWQRVIMRAGLADASHKEIAGFLTRRRGLSFWWAQEVTVGYEKAAGRRVTGQTQSAGFQVGVSRTFSVPLRKVWSFINSPRGLDFFTSGDSRGADAAHTVTVRRENSHLRLRYFQNGWQAPSILQLRVTAKAGDKTTLSVHQEKLENAAIRSAMQAHWRAKLASLKENDF